MKKHVNDASVEEIICDAVHHEDPDTTLQVLHDGRGRIVIADPEWRTVSEGSTFREALIGYVRKNYAEDLPEACILDYK